MTPTVICAPGALSHLPGVLANFECRSVFLVTGRTSFERCGAKSALESHLASYDVTHFSDIDENPKLEQLEHGLARFHESGADFIIGVGVP